MVSLAVNTFFASTVLLLFSYTHAGCSKDWWKSAVIYQIYPRSFKDSDGDGTGDLNGITSKLDHLVDLGVTALWISPIYKSPGVDHGYDISDYKAIDPLFGTLEDFKNLLKTAHLKGLKVILDFVPNHTSDEHEWFQKSVKKEDGYENYYVWADGKDKKTPPNNWISYFHGPAWTYNQERGQFYLHHFHSRQPDLNYREPRVVQEMKNVIKFWLDLGVDGFRVDIISVLFEKEGYPDDPLCSSCKCKRTDYCFQTDPFSKEQPKEFCKFDHSNTHDVPETYDMFYQWRELVDNYVEDNGGDARILMTESYSETEDVMKYYGNETHDGAHFTFNFWLITQMNRNSTAKDIKQIIDKWFAYMPVKHTANWVLGNHDQNRVASRYGPERVDGLNMLILSLPGVAVTYNGEEIGMENGEITWEQGQDPQAMRGEKEFFRSNSRDFERTPFHWDDSVSAGFSCSPATWLPVSEKYTENNLEAQKKGGEKTHYSVYKRMVSLRRSRTMQEGDYKVLALSDGVVGVKRELHASPTYVLVSNISEKPQQVSLEYFKTLPEKMEVLVTSSNSEKNTWDVLETKAITLGPYESLLLAPIRGLFGKLQE